MKLDTHVHTWHSGNTTIPPLRNVMRESYNTPERVYAIARQRGFDPDLWIIEIESRDGRTLLDEPGLA